MYKVVCKIHQQQRFINGETHTRVERLCDGFCFYLDKAFIVALNTINTDTFEEKLLENGTRSDEIATVINLLKSYKLIEWIQGDE